MEQFRSHSESGLTLIEVLLATGLLSLALLNFHETLNERREIRAARMEAASARQALSWLVEHAPLHPAVSSLAEGSAQTMTAAELAQASLWPAHAAARFTSGGVRYEAAAVFRKSAEENLHIHLVLHGSREPAADKARRFLRLVGHPGFHVAHHPPGGHGQGPRAGIDAHGAEHPVSLLAAHGLDSSLPGMSEALVGQARFVFTAAVSSSGGGAELHGGAVLEQEKFSRAFFLNDASSWWLDRRAMPVTRDIAEKLKDGWTLTRAGKNLRFVTTLPSCAAEEKPFVIAAPKAALPEIAFSDEERIVWQKQGKPILLEAGKDADGWSRRALLYPIGSKRARGVRIVRAGALPLFPSAEGHQAGLAAEGLLRIARPDPGTLSLSRGFRPDDDSPQLVVATHGFRLGYGLSKADEGKDGFLMHLPDDGEDGGVELRPLLSAFAGGWPMTHLAPGIDAHPHVTIRALVPKARVDPLLEMFTVQNAIAPVLDSGGPDAGQFSLRYTIQGGRDAMNTRGTGVYQAILFSLGTNSLAASALQASPLPPSPSSGYNALLEAGEALVEIDRAPWANVRLPLPTHQIPQSVQLDELIMKCSGSGNCSPLTGGRSVEGEVNNRGLFDISRNDPAEERARRPDGALHFGKVKIAYPPDSLTVARTCLR